MTVFNSAIDRRGVLDAVMRGSVALAAAPALLQAFGQTALAQGSPGVTRGKGNLVYIPGASAPTIPMAEWEGILGAAETGTRSNRVAAGPEAVSKAPPEACRYEAKTFQFPSGALRLLTFKKGAPLFHQIAFETEIYVIQGSATLVPLKGLKTPTVKVAAGDALFMPSGTLVNPKPATDTILLLAQVGSAAQNPKASVVRGGSVKPTDTAQWMDGTTAMTANTPADLKKAPATAARWSTKRYVFDGNSIRVATFKKGGRTNVGTTQRNDVLIYIAKGRFRRTEGDQVFEAVAGDALREKMGNPGYWEVLEDSVFIATDAPFNPAQFAPSMVAR